MGDEISVVVCNVKDALRLCSKDPEMANSMVVANAIVPEGTVYIVGEEQFKRWLEDNGMKGESRDKAD